MTGRPSRAAFVLVALLFAAAGWLRAQTVEDHLGAGDELFARFDDAGALAEYEKALALDPGRFEGLWKAARARMILGDRVEYEQRDRGERRRAEYEAGRALIRRALAVRPEEPYALYLNAALLGRLASYKSRTQQVTLAHTVKAELDRSLAMDSRNDMAWHAWAYWHLTLAKLGGAVRFFGSILYGRLPKGSLDEAVRGFQTAISLNPDYGNHHIQLARAYAALKKAEPAKRELQVAIACPDKTSLCAYYRDWARRILARLESGRGGDH
jgi:tetratricopeptide (TPR) repeat protein